MTSSPESHRSLYSHHATVLPVANLIRARDFYRDVLGFSVEFEWQDPPTYAVLAAGESVQIHLSQTDEPPPPDARPTVVSIFTHDVDALHERVVGRGANVTMPLETMDYGMREFEVADPDGHRLIFGQGVGGPAEEG